MKKKIQVSSMAAGITLLLLISGCQKKQPAKYGTPISEQDVISISRIFESPTAFADQSVIIDGQIINECPTGCWFDIKDSNAAIYVDLNPSGFAIPQKTGKKVRVQGKVKIRDNKPMIIGTGVEIK